MCRPGKIRLVGFFWIFQVILAGILVAQVPLQSAQVQSVDHVLSTLFQQAGFPSVSKPKVRLVTGQKMGAKYEHRKNEIHVEENILSICRSFGEDSVNALAFILAHELSHAIFENKHSVSSSHFIDVHFNLAQSIDEERYADMYGLFIAALAGYAPEKILNELLDKIYISYKLNTAQSHSYPSREERKKSNAALIEKVTPLIHLFEATTILTLKREYELATLAYEHLLGFYRGPELFNNLGICYVLKAMEHFDPQLDLYAYPMELDLNTGLRKALKSRGPLNREMRELRNKELLKAKECFESALRISKNYTPAYVNIMCCLILMEQARNAVHFAKNGITYLARNGDMKNAEIALGIAYSVMGNKKSKTYFEKARKGGSIKSKKFAEYNLEMLNIGSTQGQKQLDENATCRLWNRFSLASKDNSLWKFNKKYPIGSETHHLSFSYEFHGAGLRYIFYHFDKPLLSLERYKLHGFEKNQFNELDKLNVDELRWFETGKGTYLECEQSGVLYLLGKQNQILENIELYSY